MSEKLAVEIESFLNANELAHSYYVSANSGYDEEDVNLALKVLHKKGYTKMKSFYCKLGLWEITF